MSASASFSRINNAGVIVQELDWARLSDRERELLRAVGYRDVLPVDGLQQHNTDLESAWQPTQVHGGITPGLVYPKPADLPGPPA